MMGTTNYRKMHRQMKLSWVAKKCVGTMTTIMTTSIMDNVARGYETYGLRGASSRLPLRGP
jgi:hypothetical protein